MICMAQPVREMAMVPPETEFPVQVRTPPGFVPDDLSTWPRYPGRFEFEGGRLLYMPPCGDTQQDVSADVIFLLRSWSQEHGGFIVGGNEAGMALGRDKRAADAAVWVGGDLGPRTGGFRRVAPALAVEVAGQHDGEAYLREKARWYLERGVTIVWLVLPETREVVVLTGEQEVRYRVGETLAPHEALPGLAPAIADFFRQLG
jgi:Uma2 family endonuclease